MPDRDGAAVDVDDLGIDAEFARRGQRHRGERLVDLHHVELVDGDAFSGDRLLDRVGGLRLQRRIRAGHHAVRADLDSQVNPSSVALSLFITTTAAAPSEICDAEPAVDGAVLAERGLSPPSDSAVVLARMPSSLGELQRIALRWGMLTGTTSSA